MTTFTEDSPMANYFTMEPLLGGDPFSAWDADLSPEEYGDQSGAFWDHENDFTDSEDEEDDDDDESHCENDDGEWNVVYAASFTVVATASVGAPRNSLITSNSNSNILLPCATAAAAHHESMPRRDSKVRFSEQPPKVVSYECCSRENYSELYYSVHELQTIIDELRLEKKATKTPAAVKSKKQNGLAATGPSRST